MAERKSARATVSGWFKTIAKRPAIEVFEDELSALVLGYLLTGRGLRAS